MFTEKEKEMRRKKKKKKMVKDVGGFEEKQDGCVSSMLFIVNKAEEAHSRVRTDLLYHSERRGWTRMG